MKQLMLTLCAVATMMAVGCGNGNQNRSDTIPEATIAAGARRGVRIYGCLRSLHQHRHIHVHHYAQHTVLHRHLAAVQPLHLACAGASGQKRRPSLLQARLLPFGIDSHRFCEREPRRGDGEACGALLAQSEKRTVHRQ